MPRKSLHDVGPFLVEVGLLGRILRQVVKLPRRATFHLLDEGRLCEPAGTQSFDQLPVAITDSEHATRGMMDYRTAARLGLAQKGRQDGFTVYSIHQAWFGVDHVGESGVKIRQRREILTFRIGNNPSWPGKNHRHPVPAFMNIGLLAAQIQVSAMSPLGNLFLRPTGAVIRREDDDGLLSDPGLTERAHDPADGIVDLGNEVAVVSCLASADELGGGHPGRVWRCQRDVEEKRFAAT